jgi:hypothetical protein
LKDRFWLGEYKKKGVVCQAGDQEIRRSECFLKPSWEELNKELSHWDKGGQKQDF